MAGLSLQKRVASQLMKVGITKVWMDPERREEISKAITKVDIRKMISHGYIKTRRGKLKFPEKNDRGKIGPGRMKGKKHSRYSKKRKWINTIRPLRRMLKDLLISEKINRQMYRNTYRLLKGGTFRSRAHLKLYLEQNGVKI